jgi:site-specific DNA recombinase
MIAAVYARKSTEQGGVADEAKSVTRQIEHATAYAIGKGWTVDPAHVYVDDGISGAEFVNRPGLSALLAALSPRPPFDVLVIAESSRLGREQVETSWTLKRITDRGVRVFFYLEDREALMDTPTAKVLASLAGFASETERAMARSRTYDALARKAKAGHVTGGTVFGYQNVRVDGHVERRIHEPEAAVVRRIFTDYAHGIGLKALAATLTREQAPVPIPRRRDRLPGWAPSALHAMLGRELYIGIASWGARKKTDVGGRTKVRRWRLETERIRVECPDLRIIPEPLWQAVQARRTAHATARGTWTRGPAPAPALLAGLARCAQWRGTHAARADPRERDAPSARHGVRLRGARPESQLRERRRAARDHDGHRCPRELGPRSRARRDRGGGPGSC